MSIELTTALRDIENDGVVEVAISYTIVGGDRDVSITPGATDKTVFFPPLASNIGREITVYKVGSGVGNVISDGDGTELINGSLTDSITSGGSNKTYKAFAAGWRIK